MCTNTFLGQRYRRLARRRGKKRAIVAVGRSILVIIWHLLSDDQAHYLDLGSGYYESRINLNRRMRNHVRELQALGYRVTLDHGLFLNRRAAVLGARLRSWPISPGEFLFAGVVDSVG